MTERDWTPEPWRLCGGWTAEYAAIYSDTARQYVTAEATGSEPKVVMTRSDKLRATECVNALASIDDPAALLRDVRAVLVRTISALRHTSNCGSVSGETIEHAEETRRLVDALLSRLPETTA